MAGHAGLGRWEMALVLVAGVVAALAVPRPASAALLTSPAPAQYTAGLSGVIHADDAASAQDSATGLEVYAMGDATFVNGTSYGTSSNPCYPHFELVTEAPGSAVFDVLPGRPASDGGCGWQQVPNWSDGSFFWPGGMLATSSTIYVYGQRITMTAAVARRGPLMRARLLAAGRLATGITIDGDYVAEFSDSTLAYQGITQLGTPPLQQALSSAVAWPGGHWMIGTLPAPPSTDCSSFATDCRAGQAVWVPTGDEANAAAWSFYSTIPASLNVGTVVSPFRFNSTWFAISKTGDEFGGTTLEELTAKCMEGCAWHLTGKTWPASAPPNEVTYSAQVHGDPVAGGVLASYAVNGSPQYWPDFLAITP